MEIISKVIKLTKRPKQSNIARGNFCVYSSEIEAVGPNDTVVVDVFNPDGDLVTTATYSSKQFHGGLTKRKKITKYGKAIKFTTLAF